MPKHCNSASRLTAVLKGISANRDNTPTVEVWARLFQIAEADSHKKARLVAERLIAMSRELDIARSQMLEASYSENLFAPAMANVEKALSTLQLSGTWAQVKQHLTAETFVALDFCSEILPDEEALISAEDLADVARHVDDLEACMSDADLPPRLRELLAQHVALMRQALAEYPIAGVKALHRARTAAVGDVIEAKEVIKSHADEKPVRKLHAMWKRVNEVADAAIKGEKVVQIGQKVWAFLENVI